MNTDFTEKTKFKESNPLALAIDFCEAFGLRRTIRKGICIVAQNIYGAPCKETMITTMNGYRMFLIPHDKGISKELKAFKVHEPLATKVLMKELKEGVTVVDIGSNIGYYVILESKLVGRRGKVIAIEPIKRNFQYLLKNIKMNHLTNVETINVALSNKKEVVKMMDSDYSNKSFVLSNENQTMLKIEEVAATTGDQLLKSVENIGLIRLDVEGYEDHVIEGCHEIIKNWSPDILVEIHSPLLGRERLQRLLGKFRHCEYAIKYIIPRAVDFPLVANDNDIAVMDFSEFLSKSPYDSITWSYFTLFMRHLSKN